MIECVREPNEGEKVREPNEGEKERRLIPHIHVFF